MRILNNSNNIELLSKMGSHRCCSRPRVDCVRGECARGPHSIVTEGVAGREKIVYRWLSSRAYGPRRVLILYCYHTADSNRHPRFYLGLRAGTCTYIGIYIVYKIFSTFICALTRSQNSPI